MSYLIYSNCKNDLFKYLFCNFLPPWDFIFYILIITKTTLIFIIFFKQKKHLLIYTYNIEFYFFDFYFEKKFIYIIYDFTS